MKLTHKELTTLKTICDFLVCDKNDKPLFDLGNKLDKIIEKLENAN